MKSRSGFTVVELLVAAAILLLILGALGALYVTTTRAYETNRAMTAASAQLRGAVESIQRDVAQAGFTGRDPGALGVLRPLDYVLGDEVCVEDECGRELQRLTTRYVVAAETGGLQTVSYSVEDDYLMQSTIAGFDVPLAEGITGLDALRFIRADGSSSSAVNPAPADVEGLVLRLRYLQGDSERSENFTVVLP